ncbi:urease subunit beta [Thermomicrobiaceae bacterium CFH 74404]|uniref:Urease subunit beta n=1 Tax=Thermalbibacter longus TaxID=2951981 RepID=A0AA41WAD1_9BACT|nr:urease subunit beta [Thermalbibacter longus]MCM8748571.1 urease subunit beta [Thermalbibacter longus]
MRLDDLPPGAILPASDPVEINAGLPVTRVRITNEDDVPVHLTAHFHVFEANPRLRFDRRKAFGMRPDVPSGGAIRIEPGQTVEVPLVPIGGRRVVRGFHGLVDGPLDQVDLEAVLEHMVAQGFLHEPEEPAE